MKKNIIIISLLILSAILVRFIWNMVSGLIKSKNISISLPVEVKVQSVGEKDIILSFEASARVESKYQVNIVSRISGYLQKSYFKEGSNVKSGNTLFLIEPTEYQNLSDISSADIKNIKAKLDYANKQLARANELVKKDYIAKSRYDELLAERNSLSAQLNAANSQYKDRQRNLSYTRIKAPVDGRIGTIDVTVGNYVDSSTGTLTTIYSTNPIYVAFPLPVNYYNKLLSVDNGKNINHKVELFTTSGQLYDKFGVQDFADNKVNQSAGTVMLRATFPNPNGKLLHGEFVKVKIYANNPVKVPVVPMTAVLSNQEGKYVYKLDKDNIPWITYIKTGNQTDNNWIITDGLNPGDKIITEGLIKVSPGKKVKIVN